MTTFLLCLGIFLLMFAAMMIGVLCGRLPIQGSCGGPGRSCAACSKPCHDRHGSNDRHGRRTGSA